VSEEPVKAEGLDESRQRQRRWLRVLLLASLVILLVVVGSEFPEYKESSRHAPALTMGPDDQLIDPGQRVGFLRLGLHINTVEARLGRGLAKPTQTAVLYRFDEAGLTCAVQRGQVASVLISNPVYKTLTGLRVGSDADSVVRDLGDDYEYEVLEKAPPKPAGYTLHYWREGVHVNLNQDRVETILVSAPTSN